MKIVLYIIIVIIGYLLYNEFTRGKHTIYGKIGIKVWIFKGEVIGKRDVTLNLDNKKKFK